MQAVEHVLTEGWKPEFADAALGPGTDNSNHQLRRVLGEREISNFCIDDPQIRELDTEIRLQLSNSLMTLTRRCLHGPRSLKTDAWVGYKCGKSQ